VKKHIWLFHSRNGERILDVFTTSLLIQKNLHCTVCVFLELQQRCYSRALRSAWRS